LIDHDTLTAFAMKALKGGMHAGVAKNMLRSLVAGLVGADPDRKQRRLAEIVDIVDSAQDKIGASRKPQAKAVNS
jgi:hypothetical protein